MPIGNLLQGHLPTTRQNIAGRIPDYGVGCAQPTDYETHSIRNLEYFLSA